MEKTSLKPGMTAWAVVIGLSFLLFGCGGTNESLRANYDPSNIIIPPNIKSISVRPFENKTPQPAIGNKLWLATTNEFIRDGRIAYVDSEEKADGVVVGTINQYVETELSYDVNLVAREYQLWIVMDLKFLDRTNNQYVWDEPYLEQKLQYFAATEPGGKSTEQAREELWERFSKDIVRRTIEGFGTVTSSSPKSIPKETRPDNPPPDYPSTIPY